MLQVHRTPAGSIVRDIVKPTPLVCLDIVREFLVMPGLSLTFAQVRRRWHLAPEACRAALDSLVADGLLELETDGSFVLSINKKYRRNRSA